MMEQRLIEANLWNQGEGHEPHQSYSAAWRVLSRLGAPYRFGGKTREGLYEYLILHPETGQVVATGKGESAAQAMCEAALAAKEDMAAVECQGAARGPSVWGPWLTH